MSNPYTRTHGRRRYSNYEQPRTEWGVRQTASQLIQAFFASLLRLRDFSFYALKSPRNGRRLVGSWLSRNVLTLPNILTVLWFWILFWGEVTVFNKSIAVCNWNAWEDWPQAATPHHLTFIADPQLVDPHTYPGRPWPLSTLTIKHTDVYLRRAYSRLQRQLQPDTIFFLGDLFDGGREWATSSSSSPNAQYKSYGEEYWHQEYNRFSGIFLRDWNEGVHRPQIVASLPGNHDLGFGCDIHLPVRDRFNAFFGEGNRIDIVGNHTFVSLDTVSLSAKDKEPDIDTSAIWRPTQDFLDSAQTAIATEVDHHLNLTAENPPAKYKHAAVYLDDEDYIATNPALPSSAAHTSFPLVLLTHVPLYRPAGSPCGPLREHSPPTPPPPGSTTPVDPDEHNSISLGYGEQYQNTLSRDVSLTIAEKLGGAVEWAFSGDDHDYCELVHKGLPGGGQGIREITVKSISWAMGVRKPGFVMVSMYNPIDKAGAQIPWTSDSSSTTEQRRTLQTHLCLLPDQLSILIRYGTFFGLTLLLCLIRVLFHTFFPSSISAHNSGLEPFFLPTFTTARRSSRSVSSGDDRSLLNAAPRRRHSSFDEYQAPVKGFGSAVPDAAGLSARMPATSGSGRGRSPLPGYGYVLVTGTVGEEFVGGNEARDNVHRGGVQRRLGRKGKSSACGMFMKDWVWSVWCIARFVLPWFLWLQWR